MSESSRYRWAVLFASFLTFVSFAFVFQLVPPLIGAVKNDFGIGDAESGLLMSMVTIPGIFLAVPAGFVINRFGFRLLGFLSTVLVALSSVTTALANTYLTALFSRFVLGVGGAFIIVGMPTVIPQWFAHKDLGKAMGVYGTNMPFATITAFPTATLLEQSFDWHFPFYLGAVLALVTAALFALMVKEGPLKNERKPAGTSEVRQAVKNVEVWKTSIGWMFFNITALSFLSWAKNLFQEFKGLQPLTASLLASAIMYAAIICVPFFGWASDKSGRRKPFMVAGPVLMVIALIAIAYAFDLNLLLSVIVLGVGAAMVPPLVMTVAAESLPSNLAGTGFSIVTLCQNIGVTLSAPLTGYIIQTTQSVSLAFLGMALFAVAGAVTALTLKTK